MSGTGYSQVELQRINSAIKELLSPYMQHVTQDTFTRFYRRLGKFPAPVVVEALNLADLFVRSRAPTPSEAMEVARQIERFGAQSVRHAGGRWVDDLGDEDWCAKSNVLSSKGVATACKKSHDDLMRAGKIRPEQEPVALLPEEGTPEVCEQTQDFNHRVADLIAQGVEENKARFTAMQERIAAVQTINKSIPARKRRALA